MKYPRLCVFAALAALVPLAAIASASEAGPAASAPWLGAAGAPICAASLAPPQALPLGAAREGAERCYCSITIDCFDTGGTRSCSDSTNPCSCTGVDQNCDSGVRGYAKCNGVQYDCDACPSGSCEQPYIICPGGASCTMDEDCCSAFDPPGTCVQGQCSCF